MNKMYEFLNFIGENINFVEIYQFWIKSNINLILISLLIANTFPKFPF